MFRRNLSPSSVLRIRRNGTHHRSLAVCLCCSRCQIGVFVALMMEKGFYKIYLLKVNSFYLKIKKILTLIPYYLLHGEIFHRTISAMA